MRTSIPLFFASTLAMTACGDDKPAIRLTLASTYDALGVGRVFADGLNPARLTDFRLTFSKIQESGGRMIAAVHQNSIGTETSLTGTFDPDTGQILFEQSEGILTSTLSEQIEQLGGRALDSMPEDGVAHEINGFIKTIAGIREIKGYFQSVARTESRPDPPNESSIRATVETPGYVRLTGDPGATVGSVGIETFRHTLAKKEPEFSLAQARDDGSFSFVIEGLQGDALLLRSRAAGRSSDARVVYVQ